MIINFARARSRNPMAILAIVLVTVTAGRRTDATIAASTSPTGAANRAQSGSDRARPVRDTASAVPQADWWRPPAPALQWGPAREPDFGGGTQADKNEKIADSEPNGLIKFALPLPQTTQYKFAGQRHLFRCQVVWSAGAVAQPWPALQIEWLKDGAPLDSVYKNVRRINVEQQQQRGASVNASHNNNDNNNGNNNSSNDNNANIGHRNRRHNSAISTGHWGPERASFGGHHYRGQHKHTQYANERPSDDATNNNYHKSPLLPINGPQPHGASTLVTSGDSLTGPRHSGDAWQGAAHERHARNERDNEVAKVARCRRHQYAAYDTGATTNDGGATAAPATEDRGRSNKRHAHNSGAHNSGAHNNGRQIMKQRASGGQTNNHRLVEIKNILDRAKGKLTSRLRIQELQVADSGHYECLARLQVAPQSADAINAPNEPQYGASIQSTGALVVRPKRPIVSGQPDNSNSAREEQRGSAVNHSSRASQQQQQQQQQQATTTTANAEAATTNAEAAPSSGPESALSSYEQPTVNSFTIGTLNDASGQQRRNKQEQQQNSNNSSNSSNSDNNNNDNNDNNNSSNGNDSHADSRNWGDANQSVALSEAHLMSGRPATDLAQWADLTGDADQQGANTDDLMGAEASIEFIGAGEGTSGSLEPTDSPDSMHALDSNANEQQHHLFMDMGGPSLSITGLQYQPSCQVYVGQACRQHLANKTIYSPDSYYVAQMEEKMSLMLQAIAGSQRISVHCHKYAVPMLCYNVFQPCDIKNGQITSRQICRDECEILEWIMCKSEFELARQHHSNTISVSVSEGNLAPMSSDSDSYPGGAQTTPTTLVPKCSTLPKVGTPQADTCNRLGLYQRVAHGQPPDMPSAVQFDSGGKRLSGINNNNYHGNNNNNNYGSSNNNSNSNNYASSSNNNNKTERPGRRFSSERFWRALLDGSASIPASWGMVPTVADRLELHESHGPLVQGHTCFNGLGVSYRGEASVTQDRQVCAHWHEILHFWRQQSASIGAQVAAADQRQMANVTMETKAAQQSVANRNELQPEFEFERHPELFGGHNYCRNPGHLERQPWCYVLLPAQPIVLTGSANEQSAQQFNGGLVYVRKLCQLQRCYHYFWLYLLAPSVGAIFFLVAILLLIVRLVRQKQLKKVTGRHHHLTSSNKTGDMNKSTYKLIDISQEKSFLMNYNGSSGTLKQQHSGEANRPSPLPVQTPANESPAKQQQPTTTTTAERQSTSSGPRFASIKQIYTHDYNRNDHDNALMRFNTKSSTGSGATAAKNNAPLNEDLHHSDQHNSVQQRKSGGPKPNTPTQVTTIQYNLRSLDGQVRCMKMTCPSIEPIEPQQPPVDSSPVVAGASDGDNSGARNMTAVMSPTKHTPTNCSSSLISSSNNSSLVCLSPTQRSNNNNNNNNKQSLQPSSLCHTTPTSTAAMVSESATMNGLFELESAATPTPTTPIPASLDDIHLLELLYDGQHSSVYLAAVSASPVDTQHHSTTTGQNNNNKYLAVRMLKFAETPPADGAAELSTGNFGGGAMKTSKSIFNQHTKQLLDTNDTDDALMSMSWAPSDQTNKQQDDQLTQSIVSNFHREAQLLNSGLNHDNLINFIGMLYGDQADDTQTGVIDQQSDRPCPILLYDMSNHTLDLTQWLMARRARLINHYDEPKINQQHHARSANNGEFEATINGELLMIAKQIAAGMQYLHDNNYIHRDLATRNCFLDNSDSLHVKLAVFNMASEQLRNNNNNTDSIVFNDLIRPQYMDNYFKIPSRHSILPLSWMPLESILFSKYSKTSDVWSYGCVLYELFSLGERAYFGYTSKQIIDAIRSHLMPPKPIQCPKKIYDLMCKCLADLPNSRPSFKQIGHELDDDSLLFMCHIVKSPMSTQSQQQPQQHQSPSVKPNKINEQPAHVMPMSKSIFMMGPHQHTRTHHLNQRLKSSVSASQFQHQLQQPQQVPLLQSQPQQVPALLQSQPKQPPVYDIPHHGPPSFPPPPLPCDAMLTRTSQHCAVTPTECDIDRLYKETTAGVLAQCKQFQDNDYQYGQYCQNDNLLYDLHDTIDNQFNSDHAGHDQFDDNLSLDSTGAMNQASSVASSFRPVTALKEYYGRNIWPKQTQTLLQQETTTTNAI